MTIPDSSFVAPNALVAARLQVHHAAQLVASVGANLLSPESDQSHTNLGWLAARAALAGRVVEGSRSVQAALGIGRLHLQLLDETGREIDGLSLAGRTLDDAYSWLAKSLAHHAELQLPPEYIRPTYDLPEHPAADGAAFAAQPVAALEELARWFAGANEVLEELAARTEGASEVRCWPHHLDIATLIAVERSPDGSASKTIGVGLSPGDATYAEPYWYVTPWPYPDPAALPDLPGGGCWHSSGYVAAVLTGTQLVREADPAARRALLREFLDSALEASYRSHRG